MVSMPIAEALGSKRSIYVARAEFVVRDGSLRGPSQAGVGVALAILYACEGLL